MSGNLGESNEGEIFSSDGLPPLPPPRAPVTSLSSDEKGDDILDHGEKIDVAQAFEVFSGKLFFPSASSGTTGTATTTGAAVTAPVETPLHRLARLRMEVSELEQDFAKSSAGSDEAKVAHLGSEVLQDLASRLSALSDANGNSSPRTVQSDLTTLVSREFQRLQQQNQKGKDIATEDGRSGEGGVTYEFYPTNNDSGSEASLEERISQIESLLGAASISNSSFSFA